MRQTHPFCKVEFTIFKKNKKSFKKIWSFQKKVVPLQRI